MQDPYTNLVLENTQSMRYQCGMSHLKKLRQAKGLTQAQLADLIGTSQPQIQRLEKTTRPLTMEWAEKLAPHLGVSAQALLFGGNEQEDDGEAVSDLSLPGGIENEVLWREAYREARELEESYIGGRGPRIKFAKMVWIIYEEKLAALSE